MSSKKKPPAKKPAPPAAKPKTQATIDRSKKTVKKVAPHKAPRQAKTGNPAALGHE